MQLTLGFDTEIMERQRKRRAGWVKFCEGHSYESLTCDFEMFGWTAAQAIQKNNGGRIFTSEDQDAFPMSEDGLSDIYRIMARSSK